MSLLDEIGVLARRLFKREEGIEHDLLAVEIDFVHQGKEVDEFFPYLDPTIKRAAGEEFGRRGLTARGVADHPCQPRRQQFRDQTKGFLAAGTPDLVGEAVERAAVERRQARQQRGHFLVERDAARRGEVERAADAAFGELRQRGCVLHARRRQVLADQFDNLRLGQWRQCERMVGNSRPGLAAVMSSSERSEGSSSTFNSALAALRFISSAPSTMTMRQPPSAGVRWRKSPIWRTSPITISLRRRFRFGS